MKPVQVLNRDICSGNADLTIIPCSGKMKEVEKPRNQARIDFYGLPSPHSLRGQFKYGEVSPIFPPSRNTGKIRFFAFAASVFNEATPEAIQQIGRQIGQLTASNSEIRHVEAPFLGCGDGGLMPSIAIRAMAMGFLSSAHPDAVLQLCSDSALNFEIGRNALELLFKELSRVGTVALVPPISPQRANYVFDFALSFAGAQRPFVESLFALLKAEGVRVFYDQDQEAELLGKDLVTFLHDVYSRKSVYCVMFVSSDYVTREWTNHERRAAQERSLRDRGSEYILPIRFDDSVVPGLPSTIGHISASRGVEQIAAILLKKLELA